MIQNTFLKLFEEPPQNVHFILLCKSAQSLLDTILSRFTVIRLKGEQALDREIMEAARSIAGSITETIYKIRDTLKSKQYFTEITAKILIYEMLLKIGNHVMQEHREQIGDSKFSDKSWNYIKNACSFIADHSAEDISQAEVASIVGLSSYYFSKLFNEYTNMTFPTYLSMVRVQNAINLLEDSSLSITECAFAAGFQSTTTFNKLFREMTGYSPREYRKRLQ